MVHVEPLAWCDPPAAFAPFSDQPYAVLLDCPAPDGARARYAYLCIEPARTLEAWPNGPVRLDGRPVEGSPFEVLKREMAAFPATAAVPGLPPFQGGAAGLLSYELGRHVERLPAPKPSPQAMPDLAAGLYDVVVAFDLAERRTWLLSSGYPEPAGPAREARAKARAAAVKRRLAATRPLPPVDWSVRGAWRSELAKPVYLERIQRVIDYIHAGDIFQANLSQRFLADLPAALSPFALYRRLRETSPAPFAAYLKLPGDAAVLSASPERFLAVAPDGRVETRPIKGTRPRGETPEEDRALAQALLASEKDRAENLMIVDLMRNDLSRVCEIGSVRVPQLNGLESFRSVHHLVSVVEGRLAEGRDAVDLLRAAFPGGSITGAPKIHAMEIIHELETAPRGPYCGSAFWLGFDGAMDSSILIRTLVAGGGRLIAQAGGGIVSDSDPEAEYEETLTKVRALLRALDGEGRCTSISMAV